jgi:hypothetical protein
MALFILLAALALNALNAQDTPVLGQWQRTGPLLNARLDACVVSLPDGRVLITGGRNAEGPLNSAEIYTPADGVFIPFTSMDKPRAGHRCLVLPDDKVLLIGGETEGPLTATVYDPAIDTWVPVGEFGPARTAFSATLLHNGQILIAGGRTPDGPLHTLLQINPATFESTPASARFIVPRSGHTATLLTDGRVVFAGGDNAEGPTTSVEIFDPEADTMPLELTMLTPRRSHTATLLNDGRVLILGGTDGASDLNSAEVFTPGEDTLTALSAHLATARRNHFALLVDGNGNVLISGGSNANDPLATSELFSPETNEFTASGTLTAPRSNILAAMLPDGSVLAIGGFNNNGPSLACGLLTLNSVTFTKTPSVATPIYLSGERVEVRGIFALSGGANVTLRLTRTLNLVTTDVTSRLLTTSATLDLRGNFGPVGLINLAPSDLPATFTLTVRTSGGATVTRNFVTRIRTILTARPTTPTILGSPIPVSYVLTAENGATTIPGTVSAFISSATASAPVGPSGVGALSVCCVTQIGSIPAQLTYGGTAVFAPVASNALTHQVVENLPRITIRPPASGFRLLTPAVLDILVSPPSQVVSPLPAGTVSIGTQTLQLSPSSGASTAKLTYTPSFDDRRNGTVCFVAFYSGNSSYKAGNSGSQCFPVAPAASTLTITAPNNVFNFGQSTPVTVRLTFNPELGLVSRTVSISRTTFNNEGLSSTTIGLVGLSTVSPGVATGTISLVLATSLNVDPIRAEYAASGDLDRASALLTASMNPIATRTQIVSPNTSVLNPFSIGASVCTVTPIPVPGLAGDVNFLDGTLSLGRVSIPRGAIIPICPAGSINDGSSNTILLGELPPINVTLTGVARPSGTRQISATYSGFSLITNGPQVSVNASTSTTRLITVQ